MISNFAMIEETKTKYNTMTTQTSDREIVITRLLNAPRELVWKAWTDPKHLINWWGPTGFTNTFQEVNIKPGGVWRFIMHGPDGTDYPNTVIFEKIVEPELLVYSHGHGDGQENDPSQFHVTVTFEAQGNKTNLIMRSIFKTAEVRDMVVREYGAIEGGNQTVDRLEEELGKMQ